MLKKNTGNTDTSLSEIANTYEKLSDEKKTAHRPKPGGFRDKLYGLWRDKRKFRIRLSLALLTSLAFAFTFFVFGPYELYITNMAYLTFSFNKLVIPMALCGFAVFAVMFIVLIILRGKVFNCALTALFGVTVAGYLQGNVFNIDHGSLDGSAIDWTAFTLPAVGNLLLWCAIVAAVFIVLYFSRKVWTRFIQIASVVLIGAQVIALVSLLMTTTFTEITDEGYLSDSTIYEVSKSDNVIVFLLDRFDNFYADNLFKDKPELKENLSGFTYYHNFTGSYTRTFPSVNYLLTGVYYDYSVPNSEYVKKAWSESTFLSDIKQAGYTTKIYTEAQYAYFDIENLVGKVDNVGEAKRTVDYKKMIKSMLNLSAYRYAPEALKSSFWFYTGDLADIATLEDTSDSIFKTDDLAFFTNLRNDGVSVNEATKGSFIFYHLSGSHDPHVMNEYGESAKFDSYMQGLYQQTAGDLNMITEYIGQLKKLGIYDDTTIIITADHGITGTLEELDYERMPSLFIKPAGADDTEPMKYSNKQVCQDNLRASIISYFGLDTSGYARTIEDIGENENITRYFYMSGSDPEQKHRDINLCTYEIKGDANDFANWTLVSKEPIKYPFYDPN